VLIGAALSIGAPVADAQPAPNKLTIGLYAPSIEFPSTQARLSYLQGLAKTVEQATGIKTEAQSYNSLGAMTGDNVDFAIMDGQCYAVNGSGRLLATALIGGATVRPWALFATGNETMQSLRGKKLAFVQTGCNDGGFIDNAMLESEVDDGFFGARVGKGDVSAAVAEVASYKTAQAVFAPIGSEKGLHKIFDTGNVPNPAFVALGSKVPAAVIDKVAAAVGSAGGGGTLAGWMKGAREPYQALAGRMGRIAKAAQLATPEPVRLDAKDVLIDPPTLNEPALIPLRRRLVRPLGDRID